MELTIDERAELQAVVKSADVPAPVATRARIVLWHSEGRLKKQVAELAGVSRPTVDLWLSHYQTEGLAGLVDRSHAAPREQVPAPIRARLLAATRTSPPADTGLSHWSNQEMAAFTRQSIRRGTFSSVKVLIKQIRDYIMHWNTSAKPFVWTATADEILAKVRLVETNIKKLVDNNAK
ncbi:MAG: helix-turn-helix domain containing protein [Pseudonocardiales bacterium]|nr:helix-turn-helix domain containing protein [Pseudonocardiales bacterium]MBV9729184.1 helix-turn-helix domain containing protein [Pseudonocardiales bacterium]